MDKTLTPVGIDVAKLTLDVRVLLPEPAVGPFKRFANQEQGLPQLQDWFLTQGYTRVHACLEATSTYSDAVAHFLYAHGHQVSLANPARVAAFRTSEGIRTKTDRHDALLLARFCAQKRPALWSPTPPAVQQLQVLLAHLDDVLAMRQQERNRLENLRLDALTRQSLQAHIGWLQTEVEHTLQRAGALVEQVSDLAGPCAHLDSIPGIAQLTAMRLYSVFFDRERFSRAPKLVAHAGLCAAQENSGTSVHRRASISKVGNAQIRKWLYMPALSLLHCDPDFVRWVGELRARGKSNKVIIVAIMRKLLHLVHGVLKSGQDYDPRKAFPSHYGSAPPTQEDLPAA
jgi:transposase